MINNIFELSFFRILTVYGVQGILCIFFLFIAYKIIKRDTKRLNIIFSAFYISEAIGLIINFIYAPLEIEFVVKVLNFLTNFFTFFAPVFILIFLLILLKSEKVINTPRQILIILVYGGFLFCMIFIAFIPELGVEMNAANDFTPDWGWLFFAYITIVVTIFSTIPVLYYAREIYRQFKDETLKKKWRYFIGGCMILYIFLYGLFISNTLNDPTFRTVFSIFGLIMTISASISIYYGVGRIE